MEHVDLLICARWILPIEPEGQVLEHHCLAVRQGRIVDLCATSEALHRYRAAVIVERPHHVLLPGLINAHTHAAMALLRGAAEGIGLTHWLQDQIAPLERRWVDAEYVRDGVELALADMITSGTTCFGDVHLFPEITAHTAAAAGMRACIGLPVLEGSSVWADSVDEYFAKGVQLCDDYRHDPLITPAMAPYEPMQLRDETLLRVRRVADELELPLIMHVNEVRAAACSERHFARLERLGLLSPLLTAVHMNHVDDQDIAQAVRAGINVVHCPQSNMKLGSGVCPAPTLLRTGINLALGTGGPASNNDLDMLDEVRTAALLGRGLFPQEPVSAHRWLRACTLNAARALGLGDVVGSLHPGKWADLCCVDLHRAHTQPVYDVAAQLVFAAARDQISDVWVAGRQLLSEGRLTRLDLADIIQRAAGWQARIVGTSP